MKIPLTKGLCAEVDAADYTWLSQWKWHASISSKWKKEKYYARRKATVAERKAGRPAHVYMHRELCPCDPSLDVDHRDCDSLHNKRKNLRPRDPRKNRMEGLYPCL